MVAFKKTFVKVLRIQETFSVARRRMSYHLTRLSVRGTAVLPTKSVLGLGTEGNLIKKITFHTNSRLFPFPPPPPLRYPIFRFLGSLFSFGCSSQGERRRAGSSPLAVVMEKFLFVSNFANSPHFSAGRVRKKRRRDKGTPKG